MLTNKKVLSLNIVEEMEQLSMCRICLSIDVRLCSIARHLQDMYQKLTAMTFKRVDGRPLVVCYICLARLRNCYQLRMSCLHSDELLTQMLSNNMLMPQKVSSTKSLRSIAVFNLSFRHVPMKDTESLVEEEQVMEVTDNTELEQQCIEDSEDENQDETLIYDNKQCSQLMDPLDFAKMEPDDIETEAEIIEDVTAQESEWESDDGARPASQSVDILCPKSVKVVLEKLVLNDTEETGTSLLTNSRPATQKNSSKTITSKVNSNDQDETTVEEPENVDENIVTGELDVAVTSNAEGINTNETGNKIKRIRTKDNCFYCKTDVLNFSRHVIRHHAMESEVQKILSCSKKSFTRKNLLTILRKKGNYFKSKTKCYKPMKKSNPDTEYLPCVKCLGFYSRKQLWLHKKRCQPLSETGNAQVEAQNFMLRNLKVDQKLKDEVFPKMRPDRISFEAKKDALICAFGAHHLRVHRNAHFINVISRKMRELAKLLIELKKLKPSIKDLMDSLKPQNYDLIITAIKKISDYNDKTDCYGAPTYAMNICPSLKQCCKIAITTTLKSDTSGKTATTEADLKTLIHIIDLNWKFDVSRQANSSINLNKTTVVYLASDLKLLENHLCETAKSVAFKLSESENGNTEAYITLMETIYCRILMLNRVSYQDDHNENNACEEFDETISSAKKIWLQSPKSIVIKGKRDQGMQVLLTDEVQSDIDLLISVRHKYVSDKNHFLFAKPGSENTLCGNEVFEKHANACGAKNPEAITTKLLKHLATTTQMFNLKNTEIEMAQTQAVHRQNSRLPDDVKNQTAELSKFLLLTKNGDTNSNKGKSLDAIDLDLEGNLLQNDDIVNCESIMPIEEPNALKTVGKVSVDTPKKTQLCNVTNATEIITKKKRNLVPWTSQQKNVVREFFSKHIENKQPPKRYECDELRDLHPDILHNKDWLKIKVFVQNAYTKGSK